MEGVQQDELVQEREDHAFLYVEVMWRESSRMSLFGNSTGNPVESPGSLVLSVLGRMLLPSAIVLANCSTELFFGVSIALYAIQGSTVAQKHEHFH